MAHGRGAGRLVGELLPDWPAVPLAIVFLVATAVGLVAGLRSLGKTRRALGMGRAEILRTLAEMSRGRK
ncbi:hypothetical protein ACFV9W_18480 [Streptomyces sp. NPDC059897]|uniref:hypothetical protein n=1 Tax=Streptomyces sp. NPDC059897 TaxID=3346994 RepID=UPI003660C101